MGGLEWFTELKRRGEQTIVDVDMTNMKDLVQSQIIGSQVEQHYM